MVLSEIHENLTFTRIEKSDHGIYVCHAFNEHTTTNITTLINVESELINDFEKRIDQK